MIPISLYENNTGIVNKYLNPVMSGLTGDLFLSKPIVANKPAKLNDNGTVLNPRALRRAQARSGARVFFQ